MDQIRKNTSILIVEDEFASLELLATYFRNESYSVYTAQTCAQARNTLSAENIEVVLLDINLPDGDGLDLTREIRSRSRVGIILVTNKKSDIDRIIGLELGADDYVTKPYNMRELLVRVKNLAARLKPVPNDDKEINQRDVRFGRWHLLRGRRHILQEGGEKIQLTEGEYKLLSVLLSHPGQVLSRDQIMNRIERKDWNPLDRTIDVLIARLRRKLAANQDDTAYINTAHGTGYVFVESVEVCD